jgi:hypothetical protein
LVGALREIASWPNTPGKEVQVPEPIKKLPPNAKGQVCHRFVVDAGTDPETGKRKQLRRTFNTLREAKAEYARITSKRHEGTLVSPNKVTVNEWLDQWLVMKAEDRSRPRSTTTG